jgi:MinD superfamily P-loop ATPase
MNMELEHKTEDCTGTWRRRGSHWRCDGCAAVVYNCPNVAVAAVREETLGCVLHQLSEEETPGC